MAGNAQITFVGNLGGDPELRFTPSGVAVVNFSVGVAERKREGDQWVDGETTWYRCNAWRTLAENIAESLAKGARVVVTGTIKSRRYQRTDGQGEGIAWEVEVDAIGPDLRFATARVQRPERSGGSPQGGGGQWDQGGGRQQGGQYGGRPQGGGGRGAAPADDPWGQPPQGGGGWGQGGGFADEPPF